VCLCVCVCVCVSECVSLRVRQRLCVHTHTHTYRASSSRRVMLGVRAGDNHCMMRASRDTEGDDTAICFAVCAGRAMAASTPAMSTCVCVCVCLCACVCMCVCVSLSLSLCFFTYRRSRHRGGDTPTTRHQPPSRASHSAPQNALTQQARPWQPRRRLCVCVCVRVCV
jgi:hypothetical protein